MVNILYLLYFINLVFGDQPVHCLREKMYGEWDFHVSQDVQFVNLFESKEVCTHQMTNRVQILTEQ
jgi:hypothetical protein